MFTLYPLGTRTTYGSLYPCRTIKHKKCTNSTQNHVLFNRVFYLIFKHAVKSTLNFKIEKRLQQVFGRLKIATGLKEQVIEEMEKAAGSGG